MNKLTIATLNTMGLTLLAGDLKARNQTVAHFFDNSNVDIIYFQEVFSYFHLNIIKKALRTYPFCMYRKSFIGPSGGLVIFSKFVLTDITYFKFSSKNTPILSLPELILQKGVLSARLKKFGIDLVNSHFSAVLDKKWDSNGTYYRKITGEIETFQNVVNNSYSKLVVASGDFNIKKSSDLYFRLINIKNLLNPFQKDSRPTMHPKFNAGKEGNCIDYIFIIGNKKKYKVIQKQFLFSDKIRLANRELGYISDHMGLQITIQLN